MSDIYLQDDVVNLLENRFIVIIGDSIQRGVYKDIVLLLQRNKYLTEKHLRSKGEISFEGDTLIEGGQLGAMTNGVTYREVRQYQTPSHLVRFYFVTRCYNSYLESILSDLAVDPRPDVVLMNSCLWDISRYGVKSVDDYKNNLETLFSRFNTVFLESCLVIWNTTLPISKYVRGGFLIPEVEFMNSTLRLDILEANFYAQKLAVSHGFDVLDCHYFLRNQLQRRVSDGVHWDMTAHRRLTNLILAHIAEAWNKDPPNHTVELFQRRSVVASNTQSPHNSSGHMNSNYFHGNVQVTIQRDDFSKKFPAKVSTRSYSPVRNNVNPNFRTSSNLLMDRPMRGNSSHHRYNDSGHDESEKQKKHIERYGGPIRRVDYSDIRAAMMQVAKQHGSRNLHWEPYTNREYQSNMRLQSGHTRNNPYTYNRHTTVHRN